MYKELAKNLQKNTTIVEQTFTKNNLKVYGLGIKELGPKDGDCKVYLELGCIDGEELEDSFEIKINFYDEEGNIYKLFTICLEQDDFLCYDTIEFYCRDNKRLLDQAVAARIYLKKEY